MKKKHSRREFIKRNSVIGLGSAVPFGLTSSIYDSLSGGRGKSAQIDRIENEIILHGRRNNQAWFEPAVGVIPGNERELPQVFVRATLLTGNDIGPQVFLKTDDLGKTWSNPALCQNWTKVPFDDNVFEEPWFGFFYHSLTNRFLAIGYTHFVQDAGSSTNPTLLNKLRFSASPVMLFIYPLVTVPHPGYPQTHPAIYSGGATSASSLSGP